MQFFSILRLFLCPFFLEKSQQIAVMEIERPEACDLFGLLKTAPHFAVFGFSRQFGQGTLRALLT